MHNSPTYTETELCGVLCLSPEAFRRKRRSLEGAGLPRRLPGARAWSRALVNAWIDSPGGEICDVPQQPANDDAGDQIARARKMLEARQHRRAAADAGHADASERRYGGAL